MKFIFEVSETPIFQRIIDGLSDALKQAGHVVLYINARNYAAPVDYLRAIQASGAEYCVLASPSAPLWIPQADGKSFLFEFITQKFIFIHHDSIAITTSSDHAFIKRRNAALQRTKERSAHFCIEYSNYLDLKALGIDNAYVITHASEFSKRSVAETFRRDISYVGHVMPGSNGSYFDSASMNAAFWNRVTRLDEKIEPSAEAYADSMFPQARHDADWFAAKYLFVSKMHDVSQHFRGEVIQRMANHPFDIFGGDPAYINKIQRNSVIDKAGLKYHPPTQNYAEASHIYATSKINLNITSLQFDDAVINRVIDIAAAGGFVLTDWKSDLRKLTSVHNEISYRTIDELNEKIEYYLTNEKLRCEITEQLHQDIAERCRYRNIAEYILGRLVMEKPARSQGLRIDLGCGPRKKDGFVGVDIDDKWPGVDVAADLTKRFPYPDSSVDEIRAHDIIEHLPDRIHTMNELWRICRHGAIVDIRVPSTDGRGAFQDPTHVSFWNINSFLYYAGEFPDYLELCRSYGFIGEFRINQASEEKTADGVVHVNIQLMVVKQQNTGQGTAAVPGSRG